MSNVIRTVLIALWLVSSLVSICNSVAVSAEPDGRHVGTKEIVNSISMRLVRIPHGTFTMGSSAEEGGRFTDEGPPHEIEISKDLYMSKYSVTRAQFRQFVQETGYKTDADKAKLAFGFFGRYDKVALWLNEKFSWRDTGFEQTDEHPVVNVSWNDAKAFCDWLAHREGKPYRLPTEAEWEYACRSGTTTRFYSGEKDSSLRTAANLADQSLKAKWDYSEIQPKEFRKALDSGWFADWDDGYPFTAPVGQFQPNRWGLYDMHGNVWQWCSDWHDPNYYSHSPRKDPQGPKDGEFRVLRGGSWLYGARYCRSAARHQDKASGRMIDIGIRVVLPLGEGR
jgi:formylglycine-generating enzyme required for sulfatase activity